MRSEGILFAIGFALLAVWGAETLDGIALSRAALTEFRAIQTARAASGISLRRLPSVSEVGFASWSVTRIQAYKDSLLQKGNSPLAVLRISKIHLEVPVFNGTDERTLNRGVGRIIGTAQVDAKGNVAIAGHRDGFFRGLKDLAPGDVIELESRRHAEFYVVDAIEIVDPNDVSVLESTRVPSLTLVTCFPFYFVGAAPQRYVVRASLSKPPAKACGFPFDKQSNR